MNKTLTAILGLFLVGLIGGYATSETVNPASNVTADSAATAGTVLYRDSNNATTVNTFTAATLTVTSGSTFPAGDIATADIAAGAVTSAKIAALGVETANLQAGAVTSDKITNLTITSEELGANSVDTEKIYDLTVASTDLAANSVDSEKIYAGAVVEASIGASAVSTGKIEDTSITTPKMLFTGSWSSSKIVCIRDDSAFGLCTQASQSDGTCNCE